MSYLKKILLIIVILISIPVTIVWYNLPKITPYYTQLTKLEWEKLELPSLHID